ncbi:MAG: sulfate ABC transporter substrate-binding protein [Nocardioidaceae bacterium]
MTIKLKAALVASLVSVLALAGCGGSDDDSSSSSSKASVVGFSVLEASNKEEISAFEDTDAGKGAEFTTSYGASGDQSRQVEAGLKADVVHLSLEPDMQRLVDAGLVAEDWNTGPTKGIATQSVVVFVVRSGNPKGIKTWDDLTKSGVQVITPNPASSGSAKWNLLAAYGQAAADGGDAAGQAYLKKLLANTVALPDSGRDATTQFTGGTGDVLLSYENEAILAKESGTDLDYVLPDTTLLIENPAAVTTDASQTGKDFLDFLLSDQGQEIYAKYGFRPLNSDIKVEVEGANDPSNPYPTPGKLLTISDDFGGWSDANTKYFDEDNGIITKLLADTGKS